ncbi:MAG: hypothetical protein WC417_01410 [Candidatus Omnitrophota bacterium]|jgi:hypothetical protein
MNNKKNTKLIILITLSILGVFSLIRGAVTPTKARRLASSEPDKPVTIAQEKSFSLTGEGLSVKRYAKRSNYSSWSRDPFTMGAPIKPIGEGSLDLKGIIWDEKLPLALINGRTVKIGDKVGSNTVVDIRKDSVVLNDGSRDWELKLR